MKTAIMRIIRIIERVTPMIRPTDKVLTSSLFWSAAGVGGERTYKKNENISKMDLAFWKFIFTGSVK